MKKANQKGSITLFVVMSGLFLVAFLMTIFMLSSIRRQAQIEADKQSKEIYEQGNEVEIYQEYLGKGEIPIYTKEQLQKINSGEQVSIKEEGGKIYTFSKDALYVLKNDIIFEQNGIWNMPTDFTGNGKIEGNGKKITIKDTSKSEETYYYYTEENGYKSPVTKDGTIYTGK